MTLNGDTLSQQFPALAALLASYHEVVAYIDRTEEPGQPRLTENDVRAEARSEFWKAIAVAKKSKLVEQLEEKCKRLEAVNISCRNGVRLHGQHEHLSEENRRLWSIANQLMQRLNDGKHLGWRYDAEGYPVGPKSPSDRPVSQEPKKRKRRASHTLGEVAAFARKKRGAK